MRINAKELEARVVQTGIPAAISGRHVTEDGDPNGGMFVYLIGNDAMLDTQVNAVAALELIEGMLEVDKMGYSF